MATEDILIRYRADVSQLEADLNKLIDSQEQLTTATKQNTAEQTKAANSAEFAAKKRAQLLEQERQKLEKLRQAQKLAFDPTVIEKYNAQIAASQKRIETLGGSYQQAAQQAQNSNQQILGGINRIGAAFGVAFTAEALVQFAQQSVSAFLAAEETANQLRFAVLNISGESEESLKRLEEQAQRVADQTFFGDDDIKAAQAAGLAFGLTADQVERAIPALVEFAASPGSKVNSVTEAMQSLGGALEGRAGDFKNFGVEVSANATKAENLEKVIGALANQTGAAADALNTASGKAKDAKDQFGEFTELVGEGIVKYFTELFAVYKDILTPLFESFEKLKNLLLNLIPDSLKQKLSEATDGFNVFRVGIEIAQLPLRAFVNILNFFYKKIIEGIPYIFGFVNVIRDGFGEIKDLATALGDGISNLFQGITEFDAGKLKAGLNKLKSGFQNIGFDVAKSFNAGFEKGQAAFKDSTKVVLEEQGKITETYLKGDELRKKSNKELADLQKQYAKDQTNLGKQNLDEINKEIKRREELGKTSSKAAEDAKKQAEEFAKLIDSIDTEITKLQADIEKRQIEIIPADTQQEQIDRVKALADLNEQAINDEIQAKIKAVQEDAKLSEQQKQQVIGKYNELKQARLNLAQFNEQNELNIINQQQVDRIEAAFAQIDALDLEKALVIEADKVEAANEAVAKSFEDLAEAVSKSDFETAKQAAEARTAALNQALTEENNLNKVRIENAREAELAKVKEGEAADEERAAINLKFNNQIESADKELNSKIAKNNKELNDTITEEDTRATDARIENTFKVLQAVGGLLSEINGLFKAASDQRISEIEAEKEAQLASIDAQLEANKEFLDERKISDEEFAANEKALQEEKLRIEKETQKKIREEKRKQAILDKANALFEIGLSTAVAIVNAQKNPPPLSTILTAIIAATSALQAAAVIAQPIPYRKGSKNTGPTGHLARVGEEGEEFVFMPSGSKVLPARQTKRYGEVIDAMFDNRLDDYIHRNYITPALMSQRNAKDSQRSKSFAENIANSITYNQGGLTASDLEAQRKRGQYIRNVDELADAIAKRIPSRDIYRS